MPATSINLQHRLGLSKSTAAFDISLGCSGFIYGLSTAYAYAQMPGVRKVLLLDGRNPLQGLSSQRQKNWFILEMLQWLPLLKNRQE